MASQDPCQPPVLCCKPVQGGNCEISGKNDAEDFRRLVTSMENLNFSIEDQNSIFRILSSILHLGNVYFEKYEVIGSGRGAAQGPGRQR